MCQSFTRTLPRPFHTSSTVNWLLYGILKLATCPLSSINGRQPDTSDNVHSWQQKLLPSLHCTYHICYVQCKLGNSLLWLKYYKKMHILHVRTLNIKHYFCKMCWVLVHLITLTGPAEEASRPGNCWTNIFNISCYYSFLLNKSRQAIWTKVDE